MARILIANDDTLFLELMALTIGADGHEILSAVNGFDAYECAAHDDPDLVFLDAKLAIYSGYEICEMLRNDVNIPPDLPIIFLISGNEDPRRLEQVGVTDTLPKEHVLYEMRDLLVKHLGIKAAAG